MLVVRIVRVDDISSEETDIQVERLVARKAITTKLFAVFFGINTFVIAFQPGIGICLSLDGLGVPLDLDPTLAWITRC